MDCTEFPQIIPLDNKLPLIISFGDTIESKNVLTREIEWEPSTTVYLLFLLYKSQIQDDLK